MTGMYSVERRLSNDGGRLLRVAERLQASLVSGGGGLQASVAGQVPHWLTGDCDWNHSADVRKFGINIIMKHVGSQCHILKVSAELKAALEAAGRRERFSPSQTLFREDSGNVGVFLVEKGKVAMSVQDLPKLDRLFSPGSLLGLPSTFTSHPYSLTATALTDADAVHVPQEEFLRIMRESPELCREAMDMLGREVTFIQSALAERRKQLAARKVALTHALVS